MALQCGLVGRVEALVTEADTAAALGSGDVPVLATPRALALAEAASVAALTGRLPDGATTVGTRVELDHRAATPVGRRVVAEAVLSTVDGIWLDFAVEVRDGDSVAARGTVRRAIVDREAFLARAQNA